MMAAPDFSILNCGFQAFVAYIREAYTRGLEREVLAVTSISFSLARGSIESE